ncbi:MAG: hypothetical protein ACLR6B_03150 [Blautia sp.]
MDAISVSVFGFAMLAILCAVVGCVSVILCTFYPWSDMESFTINVWSAIIIINVILMFLIMLSGQCSIYFAIVMVYFIVMAILNVAMRHMCSHNIFIVAIVVNLIAMLLFTGVIHTHFEDKANINLHEDNVKQVEIKITTR